MVGFPTTGWSDFRLLENLEIAQFIDVHLAAVSAGMNLEGGHFVEFPDGRYNGFPREPRPGADTLYLLFSVLTSHHNCDPIAYFTDGILEFPIGHLEPVSLPDEKHQHLKRGASQFGHHPVDYHVRDLRGIRDEHTLIDISRFHSAILSPLRNFQPPRGINPGGCGWLDGAS